MSYTDFSTDNADYRLILSKHNRKNEEPIEDLDAIIVEDAEGSLEGIRGRSITLQYQDIFKTAEENKIPIYSGDSETKANIFFEEGIVAILNFPILIPTVVTSFSNGKTLPGLTDYIGFPWWLIQGPTTELRNAICARKTEEFIAPKLKEKLGRKPKIGIVYGAIHAGIKLDLKYKKMRDFTIWNHKKFNFKEYWGLTERGRKNLNNVIEANYEDGKWTVKKIVLEGCFKNETT